MEFDVSSDLALDSFLGTLRSELDKEPALEGAFAEVYARFVALRDAYLSGRIDAKEFGDQVKDLRVLDEKGMHWTLGATTLRWYVHNPHDTTQWIVSPGPGSGGTVVDSAGKASGWAVEDWRQRRALREAERRSPGSGSDKKFEEADTQQLGTRGKKLSIDEMFDRYVQEDSGENYAIEASILVVDEIEQRESGSSDGEGSSVSES